MGEGNNFNLVNIDAKPLEKLIEVIAQGIGKLHKPRAIRKEADAEAYKISVIEKAKSLANSENKIAELELYETIEQRLIHQEIRKQNNIDNVVDIAEEQISQEDSVSDEKVDIDWTARFFNIVEDISAEDMQKLWGRILSGEVKQPGSFSLRTLEFLKNITKDEAEIFTKFAKLKVISRATDFIPYNDKKTLEKKFNIKYSEVLYLTELGLISSESTLGMIFKGIEKEVSALFINGQTGINVITEPHNNKHHINIITFTKIGSELSNLISIESNPEYIQYVCKSLTTPHTRIKFGTLAEIERKPVLNNSHDYIIQ